MKNMYKATLFLMVLLSNTVSTPSQGWYDNVQSRLAQFKDTVLSQLPSSYEEAEDMVSGRQTEVSGRELYDNIKKIASSNNWEELESSIGELKEKGVILSSNGMDALSRGFAELQKTGTELSLTAMENMKQLLSDWSGTSQAWRESVNEQPATARDVEEGFILLGQEDEPFVVVGDEEEDDFVMVGDE